MVRKRRGFFRQFQPSVGMIGESGNYDLPSPLGGLSARKTARWAVFSEGGPAGPRKVSRRQARRMRSSQPGTRPSAHRIPQIIPAIVPKNSFAIPNQAPTSSVFRANCRQFARNPPSPEGEGKNIFHLPPTAPTFPLHR